MKIIIQQVTAKFQDLRQRIIWDNDPLFIAKDFNEFNHIFGLTDGKTSPYCPQSNSKLERFHKYSRVECISPNTQLRLDDAERLWQITSGITICSGFIAPLAISFLLTNSPAERKGYSNQRIRNRKQPDGSQQLKTSMAIKAEESIALP